MQSKQKTFSIENFGSGSDKKKEIVNLIIKSDVQGSSEAISSSLESIKNDEVGLQIIYSGVGAINESDVNLAASSAELAARFTSDSLIAPTPLYIICNPTSSFLIDSNDDEIASELP